MATLEPAVPPPERVGASTAVRTIFRYAPVRQPPLNAPAKSALQFSRQFSFGVWCITSAGPNPTPFCGASVPKLT